MLRNGILLETHAAVGRLLDAASRRKLTLMVLFSVLSACFDVFGIGAFVYFIKYLTLGNLSLPGNTLIYGCIAIIVFFLAKNLLQIYFSNRQTHFAFGEAKKQSLNVLNILYQQNEIHFRNTETGAITSDIMYVTTAFASGILLMYISLIAELCVFVLMLVFLCYASFYLCLMVFLVIAPAAFFSYSSIRKKVETLGNQRNNDTKAGQDIIIQTMLGRVDAIIYNRIEFFRNQFQRIQTRISKADAMVYTFNTIPTRMMEIFAVMAFCLIYFYSRFFGEEQSLPFNLTLFIAAAFRLLPSVNRILSFVLRIKNSWFTVNTLTEYQRLVKPETKVHVPEFHESLRMRNMKFSFGDKMICDIDEFKISKGTCIGIYGNTGEGKSTFLQLLMQLIPADSGSFELDGKNVSSDEQNSFSQLFAYIRQDVFIFNASLAENISLASVDEFNRTHIGEIVEKLELDKIAGVFDASLQAGEAGSKLSGGQKKLIALGRALYFDKPIIVLDEAFASMDADTLKIVLNVLKHERKAGKTIIMVSHQKNVFENCDFIYEFKNGNFILTS